MSDDLMSIARRRFPCGTRVRGTVSGFPAGVGAAGASIDLGGPLPGWVDLLLLPEEAAGWPPVGRSGFFEILQHRDHEIRLFPLDAGMRSLRCRYSDITGPEWAALSARRPVGSTVEATVEHVYTGNREYSVRYADGWETVEYDGVPLSPGTPVRLVVERQSEWTRRLILRLAS
ncbi:hypothetical protein [Actinoplanes couchii]|uniref:Uncharacterized protein n=1 Tax=Actinoplanes couchii TaxID=403638 RepID=A0ABQ3XRG5_9ACTN|nr:hypothetical protein [Actinoplanes couchii]MDR6318196.1 hypothetical protein [Actinoplanes couchii]GID60990.1 hypothetical protein Aco03nite_093940 [Actinoplanes couchii]